MGAEDQIASGVLSGVVSASGMMMSNTFSWAIRTAVGGTWKISKFTVVASAKGAMAVLRRFTNLFPVAPERPLKPGQRRVVDMCRRNEGLSIISMPLADLTKFEQGIKQKGYRIPYAVMEDKSTGRVDVMFLVRHAALVNQVIEDTGINTVHEGDALVTEGWGAEQTLETVEQQVSGENPTEPGENFPPGDFSNPESRQLGEGSGKTLQEADQLLEGTVPHSAPIPSKYNLELGLPEDGSWTVVGPMRGEQILAAEVTQGQAPVRFAQIPADRYELLRGQVLEQQERFPVWEAVQPDKAIPQEYNAALGLPENREWVVAGKSEGTAFLSGWNPESGTLEFAQTSREAYTAARPQYDLLPGPEEINADGLLLGSVVPEKYNEALGLPTEQQWSVLKLDRNGFDRRIYFGRLDTEAGRLELADVPLEQYAEVVSENRLPEWSGLEAGTQIPQLRSGELGLAEGRTWIVAGTSEDAAFFSSWNAEAEQQEFAQISRDEYETARLGKQPDAQPALDGAGQSPDAAQLPEWAALREGSAIPVEYNAALGLPEERAWKVYAKNGDSADISATDPETGHPEYARMWRQEYEPVRQEMSPLKDTTPPQLESAAPDRQEESVPVAQKEEALNEYIKERGTIGEPLPQAIRQELHRQGKDWTTAVEDYCLAHPEYAEKPDFPRAFLPRDRMEPLPTWEALKPQDWVNIDLRGWGYRNTSWAVSAKGRDQVELVGRDPVKGQAVRAQISKKDYVLRTERGRPTSALDQVEAAKKAAQVRSSVEKSLARQAVPKVALPTKSGKEVSL